MMTPTSTHEIEKAMQEIWDAAIGLGLDPFPTHFEVVPANIMYELGAYGIPGRFSHWSHGKAYWHMKTMYDYGLSKIYELVINTNPSLAFLLESNSLLENKMVIAHVLGHTDFFKHNMYFDHTSRQMVESASLNADRIAQYEFTHGAQAVEEFLDAVLSLRNHFSLAVPSHPEAEETPSSRSTPYDDLFDLDRDKDAEDEERPRKRIPAEPQQDILLFLFEHAPDLEDWQRDIIAIVRQEQLYFLPQMQTKIMNEGWASYWHYQLMNEVLELSPAELAQFGALHAGVVSPGGRMRLNPYYLGFRIWQDIERRWDNPTTEEQERLGRKPGSGREKMFEVREAENDQSFLRHYLTEDLVRDLDLYTYRLVDDEWQVVDTDWEKVRDTLVRSMDNFGNPYITVDDGDYRQNRELFLRHHFDGTELDVRYAEKTLQYLYKLWNRSVHLETVIDERPVRLSYDGRRNSKTVVNE
ncbi:MAG TPA: SpoVR family protein [Chloroflexota bacterium]|nr:SpoVR family protein [Chloroflexota bacterium]